MNKYGFEKGDLLKWIDYVKNESYVGLYLRPVDTPPLAGMTSLCSSELSKLYGTDGNATS